MNDIGARDCRYTGVFAAGFFPEKTDICSFVSAREHDPSILVTVFSFRRVYGY
jgi:hypothetical protein